MATSKHETRFVLTAQDKTKVALKSAEDGIKGLDGVVSKLTAGFAGLAGLGGIGLLINKQVDAARQADAYSKALGVNVETLTAMQSAFQTVGIQSDKTADILKDVAEKIGDAFRNDAGEAKEALEGLGLSVAHIAQLSPDEQLLAIANALGQVGTQGEKVQIMEALANDASLLLPLLDNNAEKLRELTQAAKDSGAALTDIEVEKLQKVAEEMRKMDIATEALSQTLVVEFSSAVVLALQGINALTEGVSGYINTVTSGIGAGVAGIYELMFGTKGVQAGMPMEIRKKAFEYQQAWNEGRIEAMQNSQITVEGGIGDKERENLEKEAEKMRESLLSKEEILMEGHLRQLDLIDQFEANKIETQMSYDEMRMQSALDLETKLTAITEQENRKREQMEAKVQGHIANLKQRGLSIAVGLLRQLGQEHDGAAYAAIALEKTLAIAQINIEANKAHMAAYGLLQLGVAGPAAVAAMHTQIETSRAFATGMTLASGLADAYSVGRGGGGGSFGGATPVSPVENPITPLSNPVETAPIQGNQITIRIVGDGDFKDLVVKSIEQAEENDEIRIING